MASGKKTQYSFVTSRYLLFIQVNLGNGLFHNNSLTDLFQFEYDVVFNLVQALLHFCKKKTQNKHFFLKKQSIVMPFPIEIMKIRCL